MAAKFRIKRGDKVIVIAGREKGKTGEVVRVLRADNRAVVQGLNMVRRHTRPRPGEPGGIVEKEAAIHLSNLAHVDPRTQQPTRIGYKFLEDGRKVRYAKRSGEVIDA